MDSRTLARNERYLLCLLSDNHNGAHELAISFGVNFHGGRQEFGVWIAVLVAESPSWCANVRRNPLGRNSDPFAADIIIARAWKL